MKKLYLAYADDEVLPLKHLKVEYKEMKKRLDAWERLIQLDFFATRNDIVSQIVGLSTTLEVFCYSGHANQGALFTEGEATQAEGLAILLSQCPNLKLVLLNGCATAGQVDLLLAKGIPVVIATNAEINDYLAKAFALTLFDALLHNKTFKEAFEFAKGEVLTIEAGAHILFTYRGLELSSTSANQWEISYQDEAYLNWTLNSISIFRNPIYEYTTKLLFLGNNEEGRDFYSRVKSAFTSEEKNKDYVLNDIWGNGDQIDYKNVMDEISAADIVVFLVNGLKFMEFWKTMGSITEALQQHRKPWVITYVTGYKTPVEQIIEKIGEYSVIVPKYIQILADRQEAKLDEFIESTYKLELIQEATRIVEGKIPHQKLLEELAEFDLNTPTEAFEALLDQKKYYHLVMIEGTNQCGQDLLIHRLKGRLPSHNCKLAPISFLSQEGAITCVKELFEKIAIYLDVDKTAEIDYLVSTLTYKLKANQLVFVFDNVIGPNMNESEIQRNINTLDSFWQIICAGLPQEKKSHSHHLFFFAINRDYCAQKQFKALTHINPLAVSQILPSIKRVKPDEVNQWYRQKRMRFPESKFELIGDQVDEITGDGFLDGVLLRLCKVIECKKVYAINLKRL